MAADVFVVKNIVDRAVELGYIVPGWHVEDYIYNAVEEYGFLSILIIGPVGSGKSNLALQLAYSAYRDWNTVMERLVMTRKEFLELINNSKRIPLVVGDDIGAWLPSTLYFTDRKTWEHFKEIWETIRTKLNVFIATAPKRNDVVSFIADKSDMLIIMHKRRGFIGKCEVQRRTVLQNYEYDKEFTRLVLVEELEFPLKPGLKAKDADRFPGIPERFWKMYWEKRVELANKTCRKALDYEREDREEVVVEKLVKNLDVSASTYKLTVYRIEKIDGETVRVPLVKVALPRTRKYKFKIKRISR